MLLPDGLARALEVVYDLVHGPNMVFQELGDLLGLVVRAEDIDNSISLALLHCFLFVLHQNCAELHQLRVTQLHYNNYFFKQRTEDV